MHRLIDSEQIFLIFLPETPTVTTTDLSFSKFYFVFKIATLDNS